MKYVIKKRFITEIRKLAHKYKLPELVIDLQSFLWELETFKSPPSDGYISVCLRNKAYTLAQKEYARREMLCDNLEYIPAPEYANDLRLDLEAAFRQLSSLERNLLNAIFFEGRRVEEIARTLGISRQAVNQKKLRALSKLRCLKCYT